MNFKNGAFDRVESARMRRMRASIREHDVFWWVDAFLHAAITQDLSAFPHPAVAPSETAPDYQLPF